MMDFGGWLEKQIKENGLNLTSFGEEIGHNRNIVRHWLNNDGIRLDNAEDALDFFGYEFKIVKKECKNEKN